MKSEFKTKLIQHLLNRKDSEKGFTLIELLVVIIIIGILAAIALPSFLNQANKARESEAKTYTGSVNRGQQAYFLEQRGFTGSIPSLGLGISTNTTNYTYTATTNSAGNSATGAPASSTGVPSTLTSFINAFGTPGTQAIKGFAGTTYISTTSGGEQTTFALLCASKTSNATAATSTIVTGFSAAPNSNSTTCASTDLENLGK